jgi:DNA helicase II / ATP-dependent DNA helicase PcrA
VPLPNRIIVESAGSGKTTRIVRDAAKTEGERSALITYTINNTSELRGKAHELFGMVPPNITVATWYRFLLHHFVRPYQTFLYEPRIGDVAMADGRSDIYAPARDIKRHYFLKEGCIYLDKISKFACAVIEESGGAPLRRVEQIFDHIFVDEVQDLAAWDLDLMEHLLGSEIAITMVGDIRQATYRTNPQAKHSKYAGPKIIGKFEDWSKRTDTRIEFQAISHRCVQDICAFADAFYPDLAQAESYNKCITGHDGVFAVRSSQVEAYMEQYDPQPLRLKKTSAVLPGCPINYGAAKGMAFDRVLLFPHNKLLEVLKTDDVTKLGPSDETRAKVYVGITRARQSVGFVVPDSFKPATLTFYEP